MATEWFWVFVLWARDFVLRFRAITIVLVDHLGFSKHRARGPVDEEAPSRRLRRPYPHGRAAGRPPGASADEIRSVLKMKTAKALGLQVPDVLRLRADEIE
jgi:hypothetical protein